MQKTHFILAIIFIILSILIFILADGARRFYSGLFFALLGVWMLSNALRSQQTNKTKSD